MALFVIVVITTASLISCTKTGIDNSTTFVVKKPSTVDNLTNSSTFIKLVDIVDTLGKHIEFASTSTILTKEQAKSLLRSNSISEDQLSSLSLHYGFHKSKDFIDIFNIQYQLVSDLKNEFFDIVLAP